MKCPHCEKEIEIENLRGQNQKSGMAKKASSGKVMSKPAFGYRVDGGNLVKEEENARKIQKLFHEFLNSDKSLNKLAEEFSFSVNGIKKILSNFTYIGKIKFDNQIHEGKHEGIISATDFNHAQDKLEKISRKIK